MIIWDDRGGGLLFISGTDNPVDIIHVNLINIWKQQVKYKKKMLKHTKNEEKVKYSEFYATVEKL